MCSTCNTPRLTRRDLLIGGLSLAAATSVSIPASHAFDPHATSSHAVAPNEAWERLMLGNQRFVDNTRRNVDYAGARHTLALSQHPFAAILSCADSRVVPELAFDQAPGDLFVCRTAGNFAHADDLASLEYAVAALNTHLIVVLGHSRCGAVNAAIEVIRDKAELPGHLPALVEPLLPAAQTALASSPDHPLPLAVAQNIRNSVAHLKSSHPILAPAVKEGRVVVLGAHYDLETGRITPVG